MENYLFKKIMLVYSVQSEADYFMSKVKKQSYQKTLHSTAKDVLRFYRTEAMDYGPVSYSPASVYANLVMVQTYRRIFILHSLRMCFRTQPVLTQNIFDATFISLILGI